jgi:hypothetical protein
MKPFTLLKGCLAVTATLLVAFQLVSCQHSEWEDDKAHNSDHFDLTHWKVTLPIAGEDGKAHEVKQLKNFSSPYFYDAADGAMVFKAPVEGSTTKNSKYPRSELRERANGKDAFWNLREGGTLTATLRIDEVPTAADGTPGRIIVGQIHGEDEELIRLYWDKNTMYFINDRSKKDNKEHTFALRDENGKKPDISLSEKFSYRIDARGDTLDVTVSADGRDYRSISKINRVWQTDTLYFKAGIYLGVNAAQDASGIGQVSFYRLDVRHAS